MNLPSQKKKKKKKKPNDYRIWQYIRRTPISAGEGGKFF